MNQLATDRPNTTRGVTDDELRGIDAYSAVVVGDGEAETGPLMGSLHSNKFLNPIRDGAVLPILHLNGYKIANPTISARISPEELHSLFVGFGHGGRRWKCDARSRNPRRRSVRLKELRS